MKSHSPLIPDILERVPLSPLTTIGLGGFARYFLSCDSVETLRAGVSFARRQNLRMCLLGGGSNLIFPDAGFDGLVLKMDIAGLRMEDDGDDMLVSVGAGEGWDAFVVTCIDRNLAGIECLSGIPGLAGTTPIQNVGAYGQEVSDTIVSLKALDAQTLATVEFANADCAFGYRQSRFRSADAGKYIVTEVLFRLRKFGRPTVRYSELRRFLSSTVDLASLSDGAPALRAVREAVVTIRRRKSMVVDPDDPHSRSVGSFFTNPVLSQTEYEAASRRWADGGGSGRIPSFPDGDRFKVPAAWLIEGAGYQKGYRSGGVGISPNHALALVNYAGTAQEILALAGAIQNAVAGRFGIILSVEPLVVSP